ncbi:MAG: carbon-nitrogen hydrolase family protein [Bacteroidota bacterium]
MSLKVATSQFPISADIEQNAEWVTRQMQEAKVQGCHVIQFPECALSGYAGIDFPSFEGYNWSLLKKETTNIQQLAGELGIWVIVGSSHPLTPGKKPRNSMYFFSAEGEIFDRYDKRFCAGNAELHTEDLAHFSSGNHFVTAEINGVTCGVLICHEYRYPELYRALKMQGVQVMFHSFYAGNMDAVQQNEMETQVGQEFHAINPGTTLPEITMPSTMISYAGNNYLWISCSNTSGKESCWGSFVVRPDGVITGKLPKNEPGILISEIDLDHAYYDSTVSWRERAIKGQFYSGARLDDSRSANRWEL